MKGTKANGDTSCLLFNENSNYQDIQLAKLFATIIDVTLKVRFRNNSHGNTPVLIDNHLVKPWTRRTILCSLSLFNVTFSAVAFVLVSFDYIRWLSAFCR